MGGGKHYLIQFVLTLPPLQTSSSPSPSPSPSPTYGAPCTRGAHSLTGSGKKHLFQQFENHDSRGAPTTSMGWRSQPQGTGRCFGCPQPRAAAGAAALGGPPPSRRDPRRILTRQPAAAASIARMALPPLQDEVGVGPLGDPQRVGQQHLLGVHPHVPGRRGRTHNGAAGRLLHTPARAGAHSRTRSPARPPAPRRKATSAAGGPRRPGRNKDPAGGRGGRRGRGHREQHPPRAPSREPAAADAQACSPQPGRGPGRREEREAEEVVSLRLGIRLGGGRGCGLPGLLGPRGVGLGCGCSRGADRNSGPPRSRAAQSPGGRRSHPRRSPAPAGRTLRRRE